MLDKKYMNSYLATFLYYKNELDIKNIKGEEYEEIEKLIKRAEEIGAEVDSDDIGTYQLKLAQEAIPNKIPDLYMKAIGKGQKKEEKKHMHKEVHYSSSGTSSYGTGSVIMDIKNLKAEPNKDNFLGLAKDFGGLLFRSVIFFVNIRGRGYRMGRRF